MKLIIMKKSFLILAAAAMFAACTNDSFRSDIEESQVEIDFSTYTQKAVGTKAATTVGLEQYYDEFEVYGYKTLLNESTQEPESQMVFNKQSVAYNSESKAWTYAPKKFWDKVATQYDFYAAVPVDAFTFDETNKVYEISDFEAAGKSLAVKTATEPKASESFVEVETDLMLAAPIQRDMNSNNAKVLVEFNFSQFLSRLNIGVKCDGLEDGQTMTLNQLKVGNIANKGSYKQDKGWTEPEGSAVLVNAEDAEGKGVAITDQNKFVYQGLLIPQTAGYAAIKLDGTDKGDNPYLYVKYTIDEESFYAYYNLADLFADADFKFEPGYQNNLYITIGAAAINFSANAYVWETDEESSFDIEESIKE